MKKIRCDWKSNNEKLLDYHDNEWAKITHDDRLIFEILILETMQAGLSWLTILLKRENYRKALDNFDYEKMANYDLKKENELMQNDGIIRNKLKIESFSKNAKSFIEVRNEFKSFDKYIWSFVDNKQIVNKVDKMSDINSKTNLSILISKDLKKRGFKFLGPVTVYSFLQATGIINDHLNECFAKYL
ncbi:DNA-3-methyladenine glycosylase I [Spiroplasma monobiae]|uniref:DNA-3-methyladenine glycosidase I n=1 Tax=Spiroplasma monobiae MQ-1 TaxID=1336748 RepID=A0A2K9LTE9_SPISQ|nr:DNA-3-methyladenine glycosylase I [Spiroplasma monobiae]AUM62359.1 DNA-3-methyladenine glycosidase I [Spiroplasma monobiae MQ-1]